MDDAIIMTEPGQKGLHEEICHMFFDLLEQHQLFLKLAKCEFFQTEMELSRNSRQRRRTNDRPRENLRN